jgi:transcriptional regulator with XRE-family HTH domain
MEGAVIEESYGTLLAARRKELGLTREQVAYDKRVDLTPDGLGKIERGERRPRLETLENLARFYGCKVGDLMPHTPDEPVIPFGMQQLTNLLSQFPDAERLYLLASFEQQAATFAQLLGSVSRRGVTGNRTVSVSAPYSKDEESLVLNQLIVNGTPADALSAAPAAAPAPSDHTKGKA